MYPLTGRRRTILFLAVGSGAGQIRKNIPAQSCAEEIKIVHSGTKQRNLLQASVIKFIQTFYPRIKFLQKEMSNFHPFPLPVNYTVHRFRREDGQVTQS